jgi:hypothetical protein
MIKIISMKMGINIIAEIIDDSACSVTVKNPAAIFTQQKDGQVMMGFSPFLDYTMEYSSGIDLKKDDVLCVLTPNTNVFNEYNKYFGSGIQIATNDIVPAQK